MGRKPNTDVRRRQIVDALARELAAVGYERASTKSIAQRAGLAPGLVHYHFRSKQDILLALVDDLIGEAEERFAAIMDSKQPAAAQLAQYATARVGLGPTADRSEVRAWVGLLAEAIGQPKVRARIGKWLAQDHERLALLLRRTGAAAADDTAAALLAMILGSFCLHAIGVARVPRGYAEAQIHAWLRGIGE